MNGSTQGSGTPLSMNPLLGTGINTASNIAGGLINRAFRKKDLRMSMGYEKHMADYHWNKNIEAWNMANQYNLPSAQVQRMKDAGLNPALMYGSSPNNTATTLPKHSSIRKDVDLGNAVTLGGEIGQYQDIRMKNAQINLVQQQANVQESQANYYDSIAQGRVDKFLYGLQSARGKGWMDEINSALLGEIYGVGTARGPHDRIGKLGSPLIEAQRSSMLGKYSHDAIKADQLREDLKLKKREYEIYSKYGIKQYPIGAGIGAGMGMLGLLLGLTPYGRGLKGIRAGGRIIKGARAGKRMTGIQRSLIPKKFKNMSVNEWYKFKRGFK